MLQIICFVNQENSVACCTICLSCTVCINIPHCSTLCSTILQYYFTMLQIICCIKQEYLLRGCTIWLCFTMHSTIPQCSTSCCYIDSNISKYSRLYSVLIEITLLRAVLFEYAPQCALLFHSVQYYSTVFCCLLYYLTMLHNVQWCDSILFTLFAMHSVAIYCLLSYLFIPYWLYFILCAINYTKLKIGNLYLITFWREETLSLCIKLYTIKKLQTYINYIVEDCCCIVRNLKFL